ncbi:MAG: tetratricopeptide repeat protein [Candidatus Bruticola sp.]
MNGNLLSYNDDIDSEDEVGLIDLSTEKSSKDKKAVAVESEEQKEENEEVLTAEAIPALLEEADSLSLRGEFREAVLRYESAYKIKPTSFRVVNSLARLYAVCGKLKRLIKLSLQWMKQLEEDKQFELALLVAQAVMRFDLDSLEARLGVLRCIKNSGDEDRYIKSVLDYSNYFVDIGSGELSVKVLQVALDAFPLRVELAVKLADIHMQLGNIQECTKQCRNIASFYENKNDYVHAAELYRRLRMLLPEDLGIALRLAELYSLTEDYENSISVYRSCMHIAYDNREALMGLASASIAIGKHSDASLALRKILSNTPDDLEAREKLAEVYVAIENPTEAVKELTAASRSYSEAQEYDDSVRVLERLLEIDASNTYAVRELSNVKTLIAQREARLAKMAEVANRGKTIGQTAPVVQAASEDDLYADDGPVGGFDGELDSFEGENESLGKIDDDFLPLMAEDKPDAQSNETTSGRPGSSVTRVLVGKAVPGKLLVPVPFVMASYPDTIELMQKIVVEPPAREVIPWEYLAVLESDNVAAESKNQDEASALSAVASSPSAKKEVKAGPVASAFASSGSSMFGDGVFSSASVRPARGTSKKRKGRKSRWESPADDGEEEETRGNRGGMSSVQAALMARFSKR